MELRAFLWPQLAEVAASAGSVEQRAQALLESLRRAVPYAAAWIAVRDPDTRLHRPVGVDGDTTALRRYFALPDADEELEAFGMNRRRPPLRASDVPVPLPETLAWGEYLLPAGFRDGIAVGLFSEDGRHLGFVSLLTDDPAVRTTACAGVLGRVRPLLARALDRLPSLAAVADLAGNAVAGVAVSRAGRCLPVPGLPPHPLLAEGSTVMSLVRGHTGSPGAHAAFLSPWGRDLVRISVIDCRDETTDDLAALVLVQPPGDLAGLRRRDLRLLGGLLEGWEIEQAGSRCGVPQAADRLAELAARLDVRSLHALLVRTAREGLYLPPALWT